MKAHPDCEIQSNHLYSPQQIKTLLEPEPEPETKDTRGLVYFAHCPSANAVKIGYTANRKGAENRVASLQSGNPMRIVLVGSIACSSKYLETFLHKRFDHLHLRGEWFFLDQELTDYLHEIGLKPATLDPHETLTTIAFDLKRRARNHSGRHAYEEYIRDEMGWFKITAGLLEPLARIFNPSAPCSYRDRHSTRFKQDAHFFARFLKGLLLSDEQPHFELRQLLRDALRSKPSPLDVYLDFNPTEDE